MRNIGLFLLVVVATACAPEIEPRPADVMDGPLFASVMVDVQLLEAAKTQNPHRREWSSESLQSGYTLIFEKYGVTDSLFQRSFRFYQSRPDLMKPIYEEVLDSLNAMEAILKQEFIDDQSAKVDSVKASEIDSTAIDSTALNWGGMRDSLPAILK